MKTLFVAATLTALSLNAFADTSVYGSLGTQGIGAGIAFPVTDSSSLRLELNGLNYSKDFSEDSIDYNGKVRNNSASALFDLHFTPDSSFRITAGAVFNDGGIRATGRTTVADTYTVGDVTVAAPAGERVKVDADFEKIAPYIGIGWGNMTKGAGFSFFGDIGAFYAKPDVKISLTPLLNTAVNAVDPGAIERERRDLQDDLDSLKWYPVIRVGVRYTF